MNYTGTFLYSRHGGFMYCGVGYNQTCIIDDYSWLCAEPDHYCNDVDATPNPTVDPTIQPTNQPTVYPSLNPTTSQPTFVPTSNPTTPAPTVKLAIGRVSSEPTGTIINQTIYSGVPEIVDESDQSVRSSFDKVLVYILSTVAILSLIIAVIVFIKIKGRFISSYSSKDKENRKHSESSQFEMDDDDLSTDDIHDRYPNMIHRNNSHNLNIRKLPQNFKRATFSHKIQPGSPIADTDENEFEDDLEDSNSNTNTNENGDEDRDPSSDEIITATQATTVTQTEGLLQAMIFNASGNKTVSNSKAPSAVDPLDGSVQNGDNNMDPRIVRRSRISYSGNRKESYLSAAISDITSIQHSYKYVGAYNPNSMMTDCFNEALVSNNSSKPIYQNLNDANHRRDESDDISIPGDEFIVKSDSNHSNKTPAPPPRKKKVESKDEKKNKNVHKLKIDLSSLEAVDDKHESDSDSEMYRVMPQEPETPTVPSSGPSVDHV